MINGKRIVLGVTGSIAAYKAAEVTSRLVAGGAQVHVVMTEAATRLMSPLALQTLSRQAVRTDLWQAANAWEPGHIELADAADLLAVVPATAHTIAQMAHGMAPDLLTNIYLATVAPVLIAPAMNGKMLAHPATQANLQVLRGRGHTILPTQRGMLACGYEGDGKLATVDQIVQTIESMLA